MPMKINPQRDDDWNPLAVIALVIAGLIIIGTALFMFVVLLFVCIAFFPLIGPVFLIIFIVFFVLGWNYQKFFN
jgi:uncharacterized protein (DUF983 family)